MPKPAKPGPRTKSPEVRQDELMNAAQQLFLAKGLADTTIEQITSLAQVAKGTFYLYFQSKEDVLAALRKRYIRDFVARIDADVARCKPADWKGKLGAWARSAVTATLETIALHDIVFLSARERPPEAGSSEPIIEHLDALLKAGRSAGAWRVEDPTLTAVFLFEGLHASLERVLHQNPSFDHAAFLSKIRKLFFRMVALQPEHGL